MGEIVRSQKLRQIKIEVSRKSAFLQHKAVIDYHEVYQLIRFFFKAYLEQPYEFTINELRIEVQKTYIPVAVRKDVFALLDIIEEMEYATKSYPREDLIKILQQFDLIVKELVKTYTKKKSFIEKIKQFIFKQEEEPIIISELPALENNDEVHVHIHIILEKIYFFLNKKDLKRAKKQYEELLILYDTLPHNLRRDFYPLVDEAYTKLIEAH